MYLCKVQVNDTTWYGAACASDAEAVRVLGQYPDVCYLGKLGRRPEMAPLWDAPGVRFILDTSADSPQWTQDLAALPEQGEQVVGC